MVRRFLAAAAAVLCAAPALSDEAWNTRFGPAVYEADIEGQAVISFFTESGFQGRMYFPGLAGNFQDRSTHWGYWIIPDTAACGAELRGPDGWASDNWGRVAISFDEPAFPSPWTALFGTCFDEPFFGLRGGLE